MSQDPFAQRCAPRGRDTGRGPYYEQSVKNAFVAVRPPGHHAETETAMGFCFFGNVALGAKHALDHHNLSRVAIVDFDVIT